MLDARAWLEKIHALEFDRTITSEEAIKRELERRTIGSEAEPATSETHEGHGHAAGPPSRG